MSWPTHWPTARLRRSAEVLARGLHSDATSSCPIPGPGVRGVEIYCLLHVVRGSEELRTVDVLGIACLACEDGALVAFAARPRPCVLQVPGDPSPGEATRERWEGLCDRLIGPYGAGVPVETALVSGDSVAAAFSAAAAPWLRPLLPECEHFLRWTGLLR